MIIKQFIDLSIGLLFVALLTVLLVNSPVSKALFVELTYKEPWQEVAADTIIQSLDTVKKQNNLNFTFERTGTTVRLNLGQLTSSEKDLVKIQIGRDAQIAGLLQFKKIVSNDKGMVELTF